MKNIIPFEGMAEKKSYLIWALINQKFMAVDHENMLTCWEMKQGKLL